MSIALPALIAVAWLGAPTVSPPQPSADDLVKRLETRNREVRDLTARFTQTYRSGALGRTLVERGTLAIKRPGRMLWEYEAPEKKTFVSDGKRFYFYVPADRQVIVREQAGERGVAVALLSGQSDLLAQFEAAIETDAGDGLDRVRLTPRSPDPEVRSVVLELDTQLRLHAISIEDAQGNTSRFRFEALRENLGLPNRMFRFELPEGVEVIQG
jgi:outer membrane lipoprotein carrier protein